MEKFTLSQMTDQEIQELMESIDVDDFDVSGDEEIFDDYESMDDDDVPVVRTALIKEAIAASLDESVEEFPAEISIGEPGPSSKSMEEVETVVSLGGPGPSSKG